MKDLPLDSTDLTWLTGLARALLGESHAAEDLVQETVVAALGSTPPPQGRRRAWLGSVARRLAARRFRDEARRTRREQHAARREALPDSAELVARAEVAEQVTAAARALPEPYRRTILLRFLEGLSAVEIARREGKPADTVRLRVRRGLELLQAELVRRHDRDWSSWSVLLMPLARIRDAGIATAGASGISAGSVALWTAMKTKVTLMTAATLCAAGMWLVWGSTPEATNENLLAGEQPVVEPPTLRAEPLIARRDALGDRTVVPPASSTDTPTASTDASFAGLFGKVIDGRGQPIPEATVYVTPPGEFETSSGQLSVLVRTETDERGAFRIPLVEPLADNGQQLLDLGVAANGYLRQSIPDALRIQPRGGHLVVLEAGRDLTGRVVDQYGAGVPELELLAHTPGAGIDHVSPSQVLMRAERAELASTSSSYYQSRGRTDANGMITFSGLPGESLRVRSLDPGWTIETPLEAVAGGPYVVWTAKRRLGVRLVVVEARSGQPVEQAYAVFRAEVAFADGELADYGQWVGRGRGGASFILGPDLPDLSRRTITRATFYGTVEFGDVQVPWRAEPLENPNGATGVAEVRVEIDTSLAAASDAKPPMSTVEMDVRYEDGTPFAGGVAVRWTSRQDQGQQRQGNADAERLASGRYRVVVPAGEVTLEISDRQASGSLPAWTGELRCEPGRVSRAFPNLPRGAAVTIRRPEGWSGEWFVHASWRPRSSAAWRGSWTYSATGPTLALSALRPAEWRFQLRQGSAQDPDPVVRRIRLSIRDNVIVED